MIRKYTIFTICLLFSIFPSSIFANWEKITHSQTGTNFYIDYGSIIESDGLVYWWEMGDLLRPGPFGMTSFKIYRVADCNQLRFRNLIYHHHQKSMGEGVPLVSHKEDNEWQYPYSTTVEVTIIKEVCGVINNR